ncbi:Uncharacterized [Syntrophomonas zehnderi OL-4]|uniref:Uncharacterized n=1 Tax=Syntrophomonas zehnderi OL-4 TaxID=690567 RepID=A0A0E4GAM5_9FIRM|nr:hypothetical protein [Syntrophomonas zehnderi]CFX16026.1 Uncharacterized [Syntrophomonas zehnderi OL-4]
MKVSIAREELKTLVDLLSEEQVLALLVILKPWAEDVISPLEAQEIMEARADIKDGKGINAEDVWRELGI